MNTRLKVWLLSNGLIIGGMFALGFGLNEDTIIGLIGLGTVFHILEINYFKDDLEAITEKKESEVQKE